MQPHLLFLNRTAHTLGGAATWLDYMEPGLRQCGWRVTIGLLEGKKFHRPETYLEKHLHQDWIRIACLTHTSAGRREALQEAIQSVAPDLVITLNVTDAVALVGQCRARGQPMPKIAISAQMIDEALCTDIAAFSDVLDAVICTNQLTRQLAIELGGMPPNRVCYGPYGVELRDIAPPPLPTDRLPIFYVGRIDWPDKRVHDIPRILEALDARNVPFDLTVIGAGPDEPEFRRRLQPWLQNGSAQLIGRLAPENIWPRIHACGGVLLLTSWTDTGPFVVYEAMSWNVAVVSSRYYGAGLEGALRHEDTAMLFPIGDAAAAADGLMQLWTEPARHRRLIQNAAQMVRQRYALDHSIAEWDRIFRSILEMPERIASSDDLCRALQAEAEVKSPAIDAESHQENEEWPLTLARVAPDNPAFWKYVAELDAES
jgi:glycosyltransferase involved in cell wall biosynthesis